MTSAAPEAEKTAALAPVRAHPSLECLPEAVMSIILAGFIGRKSRKTDDRSEGTIILTRLALTSKRLSQIVYRETPGLWRTIEVGGEFKMTDKQLAVLLCKTNAKDVCEDLCITDQTCMSGEGLEPIRRSSVLRRFSFFVENPDVKAVANIVWSFAPFNSENAGLGLLSVSLPYWSERRTDNVWEIYPESRRSLQKLWSERGIKEQWEEYEGSLRSLQKAYRKKYNSMKGKPFPCPRCDKPMHFWLHSEHSIAVMSIETFCPKCHCHNQDEYDSMEWDDDDSIPGVNVIFLSGCNSCEKKFDFADFNVCATCHDNQATFCSDCRKSGGFMELCSICDIPSCKDCIQYDKFEENSSAVHKCLGCGVKACSICRDQDTCEVCDTTLPEVRPWYCVDCNVLKSCMDCGGKCCGRNGCLASCSSCGDVYCRSGNGSGENGCCVENLKSCRACRRCFCYKDECSSRVGRDKSRIFYECFECNAASDIVAEASHA